jgi:long-subunit acyl-CoA synthetase (AMP-forming)
VIYFSPLVKSQTVKLPKSKNDIQFLALHQLEENGKNAQIGEFEDLLLFQYFFIYLDESILKKRPDKQDIAVIMYTSGSTGTPKG